MSFLSFLSQLKLSCPFDLWCGTPRIEHNPRVHDFINKINDQVLSEKQSWHWRSKGLSIYEQPTCRYVHPDNGNINGPSTIAGGQLFKLTGNQCTSSPSWLAHRDSSKIRLGNQWPYTSERRVFLLYSYLSKKTFDRKIWIKPLADSSDEQQTKGGI